MNIHCDKCQDTTWIFNDNGTVKRCECFQKYLDDIKVKKLHMPKEFIGKTLKDFKLTPYEDKEQITKHKKIITNYLDKVDRLHGKGLYMYSKTKGSGKTFMLAIIGNELMARGKSVRFAKTKEILDLIKETFNSDLDTIETINGLINVDYLLIDDIGTDKPTDWVNEQFNYIIDKRMIQEKVTMFTSNEAPKDLNLNDRIKNRINRMVIKMKFPEVSVRDRLADWEEQRILRELEK